MYYLGTYDQCKYYNNKVIKGQNFGPITKNWAPIIKGAGLPIVYAIKKHPNYTHSNMLLVETLPVEFINQSIE